MSENQTTQAAAADSSLAPFYAAPGERVSFELQLRPLHDNVVLKRLDADQKSQGGIIIPETAQQKSLRGQVLAVGPGLINEETGARVPMDVKRGDIVLVAHKRAGHEIVIDGETLLVVSEGDILGVFE